MSSRISSVGSRGNDPTGGLSLEIEGTDKPTKEAGVNIAAVDVVDVKSEETASLTGTRRVDVVRTKPLCQKADWHKDAHIYQVYLRTFADSNGDGVGDFQGVIDKLDYVAGLGFDTIWLSPFQDSPLRDGGYDVRDYDQPLKEFGTKEEFKKLVAEAHARGIRIMMDMVLNHTSDQHPWFQAAKADKSSPYRDYYVWTDKPDERYQGTRIIFSDTESSNWTWDKDAGQFFWHRFFSHQPDLNYDNPAVRDEMKRMVKSWKELGVDAFRLDAVPYLFERQGTSNESLPLTHGFLKELRAMLGDGACLLGEANQQPQEVRAYFGKDDELQMNFHFPIMPRLYLALAQESNASILETLRQTPEIPDSCQWAIFLRNHDELTLEMVNEQEREAMIMAYAPDKEMMCNCGIRRRLAPLLGNDPAKLRLMNSLLFSLPGTPIVYNGDEIGMGDNVELKDREGVRTPMQWSSDKNAGFSTASDPALLQLPVIEDETFGPRAVNVEAQKKDPGSLLHFMRHVIAVRKQHPVFARGKLEIIEQDNQAVFAFSRTREHENVACINNLSSKPQRVVLDLSAFAGARPVNLLNDKTYERISDDQYVLELKPYEALWLQMSDPKRAVAEHFRRRR